MTHNILIEEHRGRDHELAFLEQQRRHSCTDCGHSYLGAGAMPEGLHFRRKIVGGGTIVSSKYGPITEVHIIPHGGTEVPQGLLDGIVPAQIPALADLVHKNADLGTGAIYRKLVDHVVSGESRGVVVAGFHLSRILLDANRAKLAEQVPSRPYVGSADLYSTYLRTRGYELREQALLPWLNAVNEVLGDMHGGVVYHHHTYDVSPLSPRPWDRGSDIKRPAFQLVWKKPSWKSTFNGDESLMNDGLAPIEHLENVRDRICEFLQVKIGLEDGNGAIDYPLMLPVSPYSGTRSGELPNTSHHVMYDLRKDILVTERQIASWVASRPWRIQ